MADSFNKKEREKKKQKRKEEKRKRKLERQNSEEPKQEFMYIDEFGNLTPTPPEKRTEVKLEDINISTPKPSEEDENPIKTGIIKFFNEEKNFGFISQKNSNIDVFVHGDNAFDPLKEGNKVEFEIGNGPKGPMAVNVKLVKAKPKPAKNVQSAIQEKKDEMDDKINSAE